MLKELQDLATMYWQELGEYIGDGRLMMLG